LKCYRFPAVHSGAEGLVKTTAAKPLIKRLRVWPEQTVSKHEQMTPASNFSVRSADQAASVPSPAASTLLRSDLYSANLSSPSPKDCSSLAVMVICFFHGRVRLSSWDALDTHSGVDGVVGLADGGAMVAIRLISILENFVSMIKVMEFRSSSDVHRSWL
jgi:hypothetical protein